MSYSSERTIPQFVVSLRGGNFAGAFWRQEISGRINWLHSRFTYLGENRRFHPHIHCIVPSDGLIALGKWQPSRKKLFLPVRVLSCKFRGKFLALLKLQISDVDQSLLILCYQKEWVVYCKPPFKDAACVVEYLGRYTHRVAISNNRILKIDNGAVTFKCRDYRDRHRRKVMTLNADEFIRRFLMHVLPAGFMKIWHYGFLSSRGKQKKLKICKIQTGTSLCRKEKLSAEQLIQKLIGRKPSQCPRCGYAGLLKTGLAPPGDQ
ncbi:MAG: transposase [Ethanoligenens sp.]